MNNLNKLSESSIPEVKSEEPTSWKIPGLSRTSKNIYKEGNPPKGEKTATANSNRLPYFKKSQLPNVSKNPDKPRFTLFAHMSNEQESLSMDPEINVKVEEASPGLRNVGKKDAHLKFIPNYVELSNKADQLEVENVELKEKNTELDTKNKELEAKNVGLQAENTELKEKIKKMDPNLVASHNKSLAKVNSELEKALSAAWQKNSELQRLLQQVQGVIRNE